jgi:prepilin-type N-terminal cleavage/methylation domain-containing protein
MKNKQKGFSLVEILTVVGIVAVLALVVVYALNPSQFFAQGNDANRVAAIGTLDKSVSLYYSNAMNTPSTLFMGTSSVVYVSIPDPTATTTAGTNCSGIGLVSTASTTYHCAAPSNYLNVDGTGWVPVNFTSYPGGSPLSSLPKDPINTTSSGEYLVYTTNGAGGYEIMGNPQSVKDASDTADFVKGTNLTLVTTFPAGNSLAPQTAVPTFAPVAGSYSYNSCHPLTVTMSSVTTGATICYTTDGSTPTANGAGSCTHGASSSSVALIYTFTTVVNAIASKNGYTDSAVGSATYTSTGGPC